ncbi:5-oxoprolinase subunit C family protein [Psychroflexus lacisalsi]|jgi:allophanate hydrolase subunit 2|uniref:Biotin-dependent carboxyltransferase family protein n=1 Tax=Psychroflexus lacisalsi TaxID=503928 RepID=A0ABN1KBU2_9FLAO|nr:biotin-dependent carboxyltransferase family protein [Psychroflexus lacisalsi]MBZ9620522.1 allophanate hydrolase [Psychroflexus lacisalsi]
MSINVKQTGLYATIQDEGRTEGMPQGIPISGAMDFNLYRFANHVLGNKENSACIEFYQQGLKLEFDSPTFICIAVLDGEILLNDEQIESNSIIKIKSGDQILIKQLIEGNWGYIAVKDGFQSGAFLGSQSFYKALTQHQLKKSDKIIYVSYEGVSGADCPILNLEYYKTSVLDVFKGPEFQKLSQTLQYQLNNAEFSLSTSQNRMAYEIQERLDNELEEITTGPVLPGTVQYTPEGKMIALMRDAQVTGGYPRILQFSEKAINLLSQKRAKSKFKFNLIEINLEKI